MDLSIGEIYEGQVTGITKFGAFVSLPEGKSGMVHISEVAPCYVENINEHLKVGQEVKVKLVAIDETGRINLSIKKAMPQERRPAAQKFSSPRTAPKRAPVELTFEDKLKQFMQMSDSKMSEVKTYTDRKVSKKRR